MQPPQPHPPIFSCSSDSTVYMAVARVLQDMGWVHSDDVSAAALLLADGRKKGSIPWDELPQRAQPLCINAFPKFSCVTLKSMMARTIRIVCPVQPAWLPLTFIVYPLALKKTLMCERKELLAQPPACWIAKSSAGAKGEECFVDDDVAALLHRVDCSGTNTAWVIQRYIRDPLLYKGRKFDIRHWVLLLHDGSMWALSDGSCRTASVPYVDGCWSNSFVHLTNHSVQLASESFGQHEEGNELSYEQLAAYLAEAAPSRPFSAVVSDMNAIAATCLTAAWPNMTFAHQARPFQLFGFDFMLDDACHAHLLEINGSPAARELLLPSVAADIVRVLQETGSITGSGAAVGALCSFYKFTQVDTQWK